MWPMISQQALKNLSSAYDITTISEEDLRTLCNVETDRLTSIIVSSILPHQIPKLLRTLCNNFLSGLVTTIAQMKQILIPYTLIMFLTYFILTGRLIWYWHKNVDSVSVTIALIRKNVIFSIITLLGIFFNVLLVSAVIFCQTRYTIYNMPLFYMAGAVLLYQNFKLIFSKQLSK